MGATGSLSRYGLVQDPSKMRLSFRLDRLPSNLPKYLKSEIKKDEVSIQDPQEFPQE